MILADGLCANMEKIICFNVGKTCNLIPWYSVGSTSQHGHFEAEKIQNLSQIGVASYEVGVAEAKVDGAALN